ncbi:AbfB domain-containing protein [Streptomyces sp. NPDC005648]|uniref:AbfB domain-containing protein n=1 Tax=Streptomyces sp. NPDC005648 TaxID=3157044 RepID=UPI0033A52229
MDNDSDKKSHASKDPAPASTAPGLISFASPSTKSATAPPDGRSGMSSTRPSSSPQVQENGSPSAATGSKPAKSPTHKASSPAKPNPSATYRSVQSVNYPDRYWHVSGDFVDLDPPRGSESRQDSTFQLVKGLANSSCYSFLTHDGKYLRHRDFVLRDERNDGSNLFKQDATFCPQYSGYPGAVLLQSVNYPNYALRHKDFQLHLDPYGYNTTNRQDFFFRLTDPLG